MLALYTDNSFFHTLIQNINEHYHLQLPLDQTQSYAFLDESGIYLHLAEMPEGATLSAIIGELDQCDYRNLLEALKLNAQLLIQGYGLTISVDQRSLLLLRYLNTQEFNEGRLEQWLFPFIAQARLLKRQWLNPI